MENLINLNLEDSEVRDLFKGKKVGDKVTMKIRVSMAEVGPNHVSAYVEAVDGKMTFEGEASEQGKKSPVMEVMKGK